MNSYEEFLQAIDDNYEKADPPITESPGEMSKGGKK